MDLARLPDLSSLGLATLGKYTVCHKGDVEPASKLFVPPKRCVLGKEIGLGLIIRL